MNFSIAIIFFVIIIAIILVLFIVGQKKVTPPVALPVVPAPAPDLLKSLVVRKLKLQEEVERQEAILIEEEDIEWLRKERMAIRAARATQKATRNP